MLRLVYLTLLYFSLNIKQIDCAKERTYFLAADEIIWDYVPTGKNVVTNTSLPPSENGIGTIFRKVVYRAYSDDTFTAALEHPDWLGYLGPIIYAEVGETIIIHFKNNATKAVSLHPHGVFYNKDSEGALYVDGTKGKDKLDDDIPPNGEYKYTWIANERAGPANDDTNCIPWMYHSHIKSPHGTNSGLVGSMIICRKGILNKNGQRSDVDKEFVLMFTVTDENLSYYLDENIQEFATSLVNKEDEAFQGSLLKDGINGYLYGNLPGLEINQGDKVEWHVLGMGTEADIHTAYFHGNILDVRNHRTDSISVEPAAFFTGRMVADNVGSWLITDAVTSHYEDGSQAIYTVTGQEPTPMTGTVREYFIAAVEIEWDYLPIGEDPLTSENNLEPFFNKAANRIGSVYKKAVYREYTDATFTQQKVRTPEEEHHGYLGPVIKAEVGDVINVTFRNLATRNYSIHAQGVMYDKMNEGMFYNDGTSEEDRVDANVQPGETYSYYLSVPDNYGPMVGDEDCLTWMYYSGVDLQRDLYSGLVGPLITCRPGTLSSTTQKFLFFFTTDENLSWYIDDNIAANTTDPTLMKDDEDFMASNRMSAINGFSFSNLPSIHVCQGDDVSWHLMSLGKETDQTTVYFHGNTFIFNGARTDSVALFPGIYQTVVMTPSLSGQWIIESQSAVQRDSGMIARFLVGNCNSLPTQSYKEHCDRTYYIAAVEMHWDFAKEKYDYIRNISLQDPDSSGHVFVTQTETLIGSVYKKALYRQYEDEEFKVQSEHETYLGTLGPLIRMQVDEKICIVFKNMASRNYSIDGQGVVVSNKMKSVAPGETYTYVWNAPTSVAPTNTDPNCVAYSYYSTTDRVRDIYSGLIGPLAVCKKNVLDNSGARKDVDREFALLFMVMDENQSWYLDENINLFTDTPAMVDTSDPEFEESNLMHGINGFIYTNLKGLEMIKGETVDWYLISMGTDVDLHSVHFHAQTVTYQTDTTQRADVFELFPGVYKTIEMEPDNVGTWLLHCHVNDHIFAGMEALFTVQEAEKEPSRSKVNICSSFLTFLTFIMVSILVY
ncbi:hephaestin-like protein [Antedon mediterranea]|uniref:hephaestin-like protein n=1 Tax=Antedon mediterranea TaxID=105859 RepID=UPI003AF6BDA9